MNETYPRQQVESILNEAWTEPGFCVPNSGVYPHQWLWDSCFHAITWAELGDDRAIVELESALASQYPSGFVPHMTYWNHPELHQEFWGRPKTSSITQPPMFGHAASELHRRGYEIDEDLRYRIEKAFRYLLKSRTRTPQGLVPIYHPWESGCDDSPRWDVVDKSGHTSRFDVDDWRTTKSQMVGSLVYQSDGSPVANPLFEVGSAGFNALILFNFEEFCAIPGVIDRPTVRDLQSEYQILRQRFVAIWSEPDRTWVDDSHCRAGNAATADGLLGLLVDPKPARFEQLRSAAAFGSQYGCAGVSRTEPSYDPATYWRGPSWPQLNYLLSVAARRAGEQELASELQFSSLRGAETSGFAEYWNPDTGTGLGAIPQTWAGLAIVST